MKYNSLLGFEIKWGAADHEVYVRTLHMDIVATSDLSST